MAKIGKDIQYAVEALQKGKLVAIPTETVYGLAANALSEEAILKIYKTKNRPKFDPLIAHIGTLSQIEKLTTTVPPLAKKLISDFWPGPLTLLLEKTEKIPDLLTSGLPQVAIRMPDHDITRTLLTQLPFPLAAPSANPFGYISPTTAQHVQDQLGDKIDYILDGGTTSIGLESTIVSVEGDKIMVHRLGGLSIEKLQSYGEVEMSLNVSGNPRTPGQLKSHYAPQKKLIIGDIDTLLAEHQSMKIGVLSFTKSYPLAESNYILSKKGDLDESARNLFHALRVMDKMDLDLIITEVFPNRELGVAINDRLRRASGR